jgi:hypothetical protein
MVPLPSHPLISPDTPQVCSWRIQFTFPSRPFLDPSSYQDSFSCCLSQVLSSPFPPPQSRYITDFFLSRDNVVGIYRDIPRTEGGSRLRAYSFGFEIRADGTWRGLLKKFAHKDEWELVSEEEKGIPTTTSTDSFFVFRFSFSVTQKTKNYTC